jgi:diguanylate cyclase (GGDEF)-like protein/PAS domain S-box-containing protein
MVFGTNGRIQLVNRAARDLLGMTDRDLGLNLVDDDVTVLEPDGITPMARQARPFAVAATGREADIELVIIRPGGEHRRLIVQTRPLRDEGGSVFAVVMTALDVTVLHDQHRLISWQSAQIAAIGDAARAVLREPDARAAMCRAARSVTGSMVATLMEPDDAGHLVATACHGGELVGLRVALDQPSMIGEAFLSARTLTLVDVAAGDGVNAQLLRAWSEQSSATMMGAAWVPVVAYGRCVGVLSVAFDASVTEWQERVPALEVLAHETAVALERQNLLRRLSDEAGSDGLTGAANRRHWDRAIAERIEQARASGNPLSVVLLDLDHFKRYNDERGHLAGDDLLRDAVRLWQTRLRPNDVLCRWGGEEFGILLPSCTVLGASRLADELRVMLPDGQTASAGVATWNGQEDAAQLLARADAALYAAKTRGRDRVVADATQ